MHKMLYDVTDERVRVNNAQIKCNPYVQGSVIAMKIEENGFGDCLMAELNVTKQGIATGRTFFVENNCLVEVLDESPAPRKS